MNTRKLLVSVLMLACIMLSSCAPAATARQTPTVLPPTVEPISPPTTVVPTISPTPSLPMSDPSALKQVAGIYDYKVISNHYQLFLLDNGEYSSLFDNGVFSVDLDKITFRSNGTSCGSDPGIYKWLFTDATFHLVAEDDGCDLRKNMLESNTFNQKPISDNSVTFDWVRFPPRFNFVNGDSDGNIYLSGDPSATFYRYNPAGQQTGNWMDSSLTFPTGIAADEDENIYVANFDNATIHKYDPNGQPITQWTVANGKIGPVGLAVDASGNLFVALHRMQDHYIEKYSSQGDLLGTWAPPGEGDGQIKAGPRTGPGGIGIDASGNSYISDDRNVTNKYDPSGKYISSIAYSIGAIDGEGNMYTIDKTGEYATDQSLIRFDNHGNQTGQWLLPFHVWTVAAQEPDGSLIVVGDGFIAKVKLPEQ